MARNAMQTKTECMIAQIAADTTLVIPCRKGDIIVWVSFSGQVFQSHIEYKIADLWVMKEGDQILITNRLEDVPEWLSIFPTKVTGRNTWVMKRWLDQGQDPFSNQVNLDDLQNLWNVNCSHYLIWIGESRPDLQATNGILKSQNGVLRILNFTCGTLTIHQPKNQSDLLLENDQVLKFHKEYLNEEARKSMTWAEELIKKGGMPRS
jgi:hypothetical protein